MYPLTNGAPIVYPIGNKKLSEDTEMSEKQLPEWATLGEASNHVPVTRETLRRMIADGRIEPDCWRVIPIGSREYYQVKMDCIINLDFNNVGRQPKSNNKN